MNVSTPDLTAGQIIDFPKGARTVRSIQPTEYVAADGTPVWYVNLTYVPGTVAGYSGLETDTWPIIGVDDFEARYPDSYRMPPGLIQISRQSNVAIFEDEDGEPRRRHFTYDPQRSLADRAAAEAESAWLNA